MSPPSIVILTGAGISAESGVDTFRGTGGLWSKVKLEEVATPEGFAVDPEKVHAFYNKRRAALASIKPNKAHVALAELEARHTGDFLLVTQNIDNLHERAGSRKLLHMHGELTRALCTRCGMRCEWTDEMHTMTPCPQCLRTGSLRPDVVWFGEMPYHMEEIQTALARCDLFVSIGTSGSVYPAAGFVAEASAAGAHTVELNLEPSEGVSHFGEVIHGKAGKTVPAFVKRLLASA